MSQDKYPSLFSRQMEAIVFIIRRMLIATRAVYKIEEYTPVLAREYSVAWHV